MSIMILPLSEAIVNDSGHMQYTCSCWTFMRIAQLLRFVANAQNIPYLGWRSTGKVNKSQRDFLNRTSGIVLGAFANPFQSMDIWGCFTRSWSARCCLEYERTSRDIFSTLHHEGWLTIEDSIKVSLLENRGIYLTCQIITFVLAWQLEPAHVGWVVAITWMVDINHILLKASACHVARCWGDLRDCNLAAGEKPSSLGRDCNFPPAAARVSNTALVRMENDDWDDGSSCQQVKACFAEAVEFSLYGSLISESVKPRPNPTSSQPRTVGMHWHLMMGTCLTRVFAFPILRSIYLNVLVFSGPCP